MRNIVMFSLLLVAGLSFAQLSGTPGEEIMDCQKDCCGLYGGTWDTADQYCKMDYDSDEYYDYSDCVEVCIEGVAMEEGWTGGNEWTDGNGDVVCCGSAFALLGLVGFVAIRR